MSNESQNNQNKSMDAHTRKRRTRAEIIHDEQLKIEELEKKLAEKKQKIEQLKTVLETKQSSKERKEENRKFLRFGKEIYKFFALPGNQEITEEIHKGYKNLLKKAKKSEPTDKKSILYYEDIVEIMSRALAEAIAQNSENIS